MLDAKDLEAIAILLDKKLDEKLDEKLDSKFSAFKEGLLEETDRRLEIRIAASEKNLLREMNKRLERRVTKCESNLLTEMERLYQRTNDRITLADERVGKLDERYNGIKIENNNTALIMQMITALQKDVEEIKAKIA